MKTIRILLLLALIGLGFAGGFGYGRWYGPGVHASQENTAQLYHCPMHPAYVSDKPGDCPICGMRLVPIRTEEERAPAATEGHGKILYYRDPENHEYTSHEPGLNPETGNELEPVYESGPSMPPGAIQISPERQQLIGVQYGTVEWTSGVETVRAVGAVTYDETRVAHIHTKVEGWVEKVFADFTGKLVGKGQPLVSVYSPELLASQRELLLAGKARGLMKNNPLNSAFNQSETLFEAARRRLELWDVSAEQINRILETQQPMREVTVYSPVNGFVLERNAFQNLRVTPETNLYTIADLSRVWIMADVYESDLARIRLGQTARVSLSYMPGKTFNARVSNIQPQLDPVTRTVKVRMEVDNPAFTLKPEMYVDVDFRIPLSRELTVPSEAVLDTGERQTVFVGLGNGYLEPREVVTGGQRDSRTVILRGLKPGELVVTSGNFLIDSESRMKAAAAGMGAPGTHVHGTESQHSIPMAAPTAEGHRHD